MEIKKKLSVSILLLISILPLINAVSLNNTLLQSIGLNSSINITNNINFDLLIITDYSIEIYNLTYIHPSSCNLQLSNITFFNYTNSNEVTTFSNAFSYISCESGSSSGGYSSIQNISVNNIICNITYDYVNKKDFNISKIILEINNSKISFNESLNIYLNNWQEICSDLIHRSLDEDFVCSVLDKNNLNVNKSYLEINERIKISNNLLNYYIINYEKMCKIKVSTSNIINMTNIILFLVISLLVLVVIFMLFYIYRKFYK